MRNSKFLIIAFLADSVLKFSTEIYIFIKHPKNWDFLHFPLNAALKKQIWSKILFMVLIERSSEWCTHSVQPWVIWV